MSTSNLFGEPTVIKREGIPIVIKGDWFNNQGVSIKAADLGDEVTFQIYTQNIKSGEKVQLSLFEKNTISNTDLGKKYDCTIISDMGIVYVKLDKSWSSYLNEWGEGDELEIYFKVKYKDINKELSTLEVYDSYTITVLIELPHSSATAKLSQKGLAGHTGIIINDDFYDYGPQPGQGGNIRSKGRPWWDKKSLGGLNSEGDMKRKDIMNILNSVQNREDTDIKGRVVLIDIVITKDENIKVEKWWKDKYDDLGSYSVWIVAGSQCTTTVRQSLEEKTKVLQWVNTGFTQTPEGLMELLTEEGQHTNGIKKGDKLVITHDFPEI